MNDDTTADSRLPPRKLIQHGLKRNLNDESTSTSTTAGQTGTGGRTTNATRTGSSKRARCSILDLFGSISVRDDDMDNDQVVDNSFASSCAVDNGQYNGNGSMVDGFSTEDKDDEGDCDDRQSLSGPEDDDDDDDDELLSDEELLRRRLEKQVFHKLALGRGAAADATTEDPVERKFAQIVFRCMMINKEAAVTAARKDSDHIHDTSPPARSSGAAAVADPSLPSTTTSGGGGDAANVATTAWSQQLESMDLD